MFQIGDLIIYGNNGVCRVDEIGPSKIGGTKDCLYYTLEPLFGSGTIYTPVETKVFMRPIITKDEAENLIDQIPNIHEDICVNKKISVLKEHYTNSIQSHTCRDLVQIIKEISVKEQRAIQNRQHLGQIDQHFLKQAEDMLYGELSIALSIPKEDVLPYIKKRIDALSCS